MIYCVGGTTRIVVAKYYDIVSDRSSTIWGGCEE